MAVPDFQSLMLPVLRALTDGSATPVAEVCARVAAAEGLTPDDLLERTRGGHTTRLKESGKLEHHSLSIRWSGGKGPPCRLSDNA